MGVIDITREIGHVRNQKDPGSNWHAIALQKVQDAIKALQGFPALGSVVTYTPVVTAGSGVFTTVSATGRYRQIGKLVFIQITVTITTNGTAATSVIATLPLAAVNVAGVNHVLAGRANAVSGKMLQGIIGPNSPTVTIFNYDGTYPGATGETLVLSGFYETN